MEPEILFAIGRTKEAESNDGASPGASPSKPEPLLT